MMLVWKRDTKNIQQCMNWCAWYTLNGWKVPLMQAYISLNKQNLVEYLQHEYNSAI